MKYVYIVAMATGHGASINTGKCAYRTFAEAKARVEQYHAEGMTWMKVYTLEFVE